METKLRKDTGQYRLLHFQPDPEDGDRVCVGVLLNEGGKFAVLSDPKFKKLRCVAPDFEPGLVSFYLRDLEDSLNRSREPVEVTLRRCAPQVVVSQARSVSMPLTPDKRLRLIERFVLPAKELPKELVAAFREETSTSERLRIFLSEIAPWSASQIIRNAGPLDLFNLALPNIKPVAFAFRRPSKVIVVDGVDLSVMTPTRAVTKANRIAHNFWQYGRIREESLFTGRLTVDRVGVVMNGTSPKTEAYLDAHDYALHQFKNEADVAVDASSGEGKEQLRAVLAAEK
jgi:hypothetical protein